MPEPTHSGPAAKCDGWLRRRGIQVIWWGFRWPWKWRFYYVEHPEWGWNELLLGFVGISWVNRRWR